MSRSIEAGLALSQALAPLSFGIVDGETIFMDLQSDSYFCLEATGHDSAEQSQAAVFGEESASIVQAIAEPPSRSSASAASVRLPDMIAVARLVWSTRARLRRQKIDRVLAHVLSSAAQRDFGHRSGTGPEGRAAVFMAARKLVPVKRNCLLDSLALLRWLGAGRDEAELVFGVKLHPFAAHCWVQSGDLLLNDSIDTVAQFTPVRIIRCSPAMR